MSNKLSRKEGEEVISVWTGSEYIKQKKPVKKKIKKKLKSKLKKWHVGLIIALTIIITVILLLQ